MLFEELERFRTIFAIFAYFIAFLCFDELLRVTAYRIDGKLLIYVGI